MVKDLRYEGVKTMIETGRITEFKQIFLILPKSLIARAIRTNNNRMTDLINDAGRITIEEIYTIASLLEIDYDKIHELLKTQYLGEMKVSDSNKEDSKDAARDTNKVMDKIKKKK